MFTSRENTKHKPQTRNPGTRGTGTAFEKAWNDLREPAEPPPTVSGRWLLGAIGCAVAGAALCFWGVLCLLFWQGSWQLLYHPAATIARTPASVPIAFDPVEFAATETGHSQLTGWWIPAAPNAAFTGYSVLYLHGQNGNLGDAVDTIASLHACGVNVLAFDYRGYGQSEFARPGEARWREDAEFALEYLEGTRHIAAGKIVLYGDQLGANLALELAAAHSELAGVTLRNFVDNPTQMIFGDGRARLVPARLLVSDRYDRDAYVTALRVPSLWLYKTDALSGKAPAVYADAVAKIAVPKTLAATARAGDPDNQDNSAFSKWLGNLPATH